MTAYNCLWRIQHGEPVGGNEWKAAAEYLPVKSLWKEPLLKHGFKAKWLDGRMDDSCDFLRPEDLEDIGGATPFLLELVKKGEWGSLVDGGKKWIEAAKRHGPEMATSPKVRLSTIHGAKGMEADDVILATSTSRRTEEAQENSPDAFDEECRIEYVAVTRARQNLMVCETDEPFTMRLPL
jgi:superfamily I DNA/RNA helicase